MKTFTSILSTWLLAAAIVIGRAWWRVYVLDDFSEKWGRSATFGFTWEPVSIGLLAGIVSVPLVRFGVRRRRVIDGVYRGFFCGLLAFSVWWPLVQGVSHAFRSGLLPHSNPLQFIMVFGCFPAAIAVSILLVGKKPNQSEEGKSREEKAA